MTKREILMETQRIGSILRITAIDAVTGTEVVFQAPAATSRLSLERLSEQKLTYVMSKK